MYSSRRKHKRAVVAMQFQWMFALIAGALILFFFISGALSIRSTEQSKIALEGMQNIDTLFMAALADEDVTRFVSTPGTLSLDFSCVLQEFDPLIGRRTLISTYGLADQDIYLSSNSLPVFSPASLKSSSFILHTSPFSLPFRVDRSLYLTSYEHHFVFFKEGLNGAPSTEYLSDLFPENISVSIYDSFDAFTQQTGFSGGDYTLVLASADPTSLPGISPSVEERFSELSASGTVRLRTVSIDSKSVGFYTWKQSSNTALFRPDGAVATYVDDGTLLGTLFAEGGQDYSCTVEKLYRRYLSVAELHASRYVGYVNTISDTQCLQWYQQSADLINQIIALDVPFYQFSASDLALLENNVNQLQQLRTRVEVNSCPSLF